MKTVEVPSTGSPPAQANLLLRLFDEPFQAASG
jgi:hypothetical protein